MKIRFKNGKEIDYINAIETEEYFNGSNRRTLTFECDVNSVSVDELNNTLSSEENVSEITLTSEQIAMLLPEGEELMQSQPLQNIYNGYVLKLKCGIESKLVSTETTETQAVYEDRIIFKLGKRTYIEEQLHKLGL